MFDQQPVKDEVAIQEIKRTSNEMAGWLKFIGVVAIVYGALIALTIVGIIIAWLPIWMGIMLYSAGKKANDAQFSNNPMYLVEMMRKLKTFFLVQGVLLIIGLIGIIIAIVTVGIGFFSIMNRYSY